MNDTDSTTTTELELDGAIDRNGVYALEFTADGNTWYFECIAAGGRISAFELNGENILVDVANTNAPELDGSTFWTSPQKGWYVNSEWPPPPAIDSEVYSAEVNEDEKSITLTGPVDAGLGVRIVKKYTADIANLAIKIDYTIENTSGATVSMAPWEISRVNPDGLTFYPTGSNAASGTLAGETSTSGGITWYQHSSSMTGDGKLFADGGDGWIAHAISDKVLIKTFSDISTSDAAPGEAEIEIYAKDIYVEVEQQGAYEDIADGNSSTWTLYWKLMPLSSDVSVETGSDSLVSFVEANK